MWVKDAATGVGTLSFYIPKTGQFVALGHGIIDSDSESLINIDYGEVTSTNIVSIVKGESGSPGEVKGTVNNDVLGTIYDNTDFGLFGEIINVENNNWKTMEIGLRNEIREGEARILSNIEGNGVKDEVLDLCDDYLYIDISDKVESLNVGVATSIILYELNKRG